MLPRNHPDRIQIAFDDHRLVANAGLLPSATLAQHLGLGELVDHHLDLGGAPGRANTGDKLLTLVRCAPVGRPAFSAAWSRRHPPWAPSCAASGGGPRREPPAAGPGLTATLNLGRLDHPHLVRA